MSVGPTTKFGVVEFDAKPRAWKAKLVPANEANVRAAVTFLNRAKPYGPTNVIDSLRLAKKTPQVDAIVLLSDGKDESTSGFEPGSLHTLEEALDQALSQGETVTLGDTVARVIDVSGHTIGHIAFVIDATKVAFTSSASEVCAAAVPTPPINANTVKTCLMTTSLEDRGLPPGRISRS